METEENYVGPGAEPVLTLTQQAQFYLQQAGKWATFLGVVGFIFTGFIAIGALSVGTILTYLSAVNPLMQFPAGISIIVTIVYLLIALLLFFYSLYLFQFGSRIKKGIYLNNADETALAFSKLKSFFKLWGIITIVIIAFYVLIFAFAILGGLLGASRM
jgi:flagellar biogenesis protein FliO